MNGRIFEDIKRVKQPNKPIDEEIICHFVNGPYVEIKCPVPYKYQVVFRNGANVIYNTTINSNNWTSAYPKYFQPYNVEIKNLTTGKTNIRKCDLNGQRVSVQFKSGSLGDNIAWIPYVDEFQRKHKCIVEVSTFFNFLFEKQYPNLKFVPVGAPYVNMFARYEIGWFYNDETGLYDQYRNPLDPKSHPLQKTCSDILGLKFKEIKPKIDFTPSERPYRSKYVCIANHATLQAKYWNNKVGWQKLVDHLKKLGYVVVLLSKEKDGHKGNYNPKGIEYPKNHEMNTIMNYLHHSEFFVGLGSGLSWLSWALDVKTVLISGFSEAYTEMESCVRITAPKFKCNGCFNWVKLQNDGDFNWCPKHKNTEKHFECTKSITANMVIAELEQQGLIEVSSNE